MDSRRDALVSPFTLNNGVTVPGRLTAAPLTLYCQEPDGSVSEAERAFLSARGRGFGLYILGATLVTANGQGFPGQPRALYDTDMPSLKERVQLIRRKGALVITQLHHAGNKGRPEFLPRHEVVAPSDDPETGARGLNPAEVKAVIHGFAHAADLAMASGADGVEVHGANQYLLQQFFSRKTNRRTDAWGGTLEKRMAMPLAALDAVLREREKYGKKDFIVGYRLSPEEPGELGITMEETLALVRELVKRPIQYIHVSQKHFWQTARRGADTSRARLELIREAVGGKCAVIGLGDLWTGEDFEKALGTGWVDFVATGRALMLNPRLPELIREGKDSEIQTSLNPVSAKTCECPEVLWPRLPHAEGFSEKA